MCEYVKKKYEYISRSWQENWEYLSSFLSYPSEIRWLIYMTNPIESFNRCLRKVTKNKPTFLSEDALMKNLYLGVRRLERKWTTKVRNWSIIYSLLLILFSDRLNKVAAVSDFAFTQNYLQSLEIFRKDS
ncbi:MAG: transposase [Holosporaceae bacterium]|nr:transposase [Holosporaceae bacterium]